AVATRSKGRCALPQHPPPRGQGTAPAALRAARAGSAHPRPARQGERGAAARAPPVKAEPSGCCAALTAPARPLGQGRRLAENRAGAEATAGIGGAPAGRGAAPSGDLSPVGAGVAAPTTAGPTGCWRATPWARRLTQG